MTNKELAASLRELAESFKWPWPGEPGSNPDYFDFRELGAVLEAADRLEKLDDGAKPPRGGFF